MKFLKLIFFIAYSFFTFADIDDSSFKNSDRYVFLKDQSIPKTNSFNLEIKFIPPKGKKVNKASFVRVWEKQKNNWEKTDNLEIQEISEEFENNILTHNAILKSRLSIVAIEIDFIHCDFKGGQCASEKYLSKILRDKNTKKAKISYTLKI
jgi:hypothetical protein